MLGIVVFHMIGFFLCSLFLDEKTAVEIAKNTKHLRIRGKVFIDGAGGGGSGSISNGEVASLVVNSEARENAVL